MPRRILAKTAGFTLIELTVVFAIIASLAALAMLMMVLGLTVVASSMVTVPEWPLVSRTLAKSLSGLCCLALLGRHQTPHHSDSSNSHYFPLWCTEWPSELIRFRVQPRNDLF